MRGRGILITNLGSPASPTPVAVRQYLEEFLMDPFVITLPSILRYLLVKTIAKTRSPSSAAAYAKIWTPTGGPLRDHAEQLAEKLRQSTSLPVAVGMRYGHPSFQEAYEYLKGECDETLVISAYPHYAGSTFKSSVERLKQVFGDMQTLITRPYFSEPGFIDAHVDRLREYISSDVEHLLFSFHGVPEAHIRLSDPSRQHCLRVTGCCELEHSSHQTCYRHQCLRTAELLGKQVDIPTTVAFQSRLGPSKWLQPYTIEAVQVLAKQGVRKLAVACPSFISDNVETLYEISVEVKAAFLEAGGTRLDAVPCLNESEKWLAQIVKWSQEPSDQLAKLADF